MTNGPTEGQTDRPTNGPMDRRVDGQANIQRHADGRLNGTYVKSLLRINLVSCHDGIKVKTKFNFDKDVAVLTSVSR